MRNVAATWWERLSWLALGLLAASAGFWLLGPRAGVDTALPASAEPRPAAAPPETPQPVPECYLGVVLAREEVDVTSEVGGTLEELTVRVGDALQHGERIARLDTRTLIHRLAVERAALEAARAEKRRQALEVERTAQEHQRLLALEGLLSQAETENARFQHEMAQARLEGTEAEVQRARARLTQLESDLERSELRAPFEGMVTRRYMDPGTLVAPGTAVIRLISSTNLLVRFAVPPEAVKSFPISTEARLELEQLGITATATVEHLAPEIDAASRMVFVEARLEGSAHTIPSGAVARVSILAGADSPSCLGR